MTFLPFAAFGIVALVMLAIAFSIMRQLDSAIEQAKRGSDDVDPKP